MKNANETTQTFRISKSYVGYESKNRPNYETGLTIEQAIFSLDVTESSWIRNGGTIIERNEDSLTVEEGDGSQVIIFSINEE